MMLTINDNDNQRRAQINQEYFTVTDYRYLVFNYIQYMSFVCKKIQKAI